MQPFSEVWCQRTQSEICLGKLGVMPMFVPFFFLLSYFFFQFPAILFQILTNTKSDFSYIISLEFNHKEPHITYPSNSSQIPQKKKFKYCSQIIVHIWRTATHNSKFSSLFISESYHYVIPFKTPYSLIFFSLFPSSCRPDSPKSILVSQPCVLYQIWNPSIVLISFGIRASVHINKCVSKC